MCWQHGRREQRLVADVGCRRHAVARQRDVERSVQRHWRCSYGDDCSSSDIDDDINHCGLDERLLAAAVDRSGSVERVCRVVALERTVPRTAASVRARLRRRRKSCAGLFVDFVSDFCFFFCFFLFFSFVLFCFWFVVNQYDLHSVYCCSPTFCVC